MTPTRTMILLLAVLGLSACEGGAFSLTADPAAGEAGMEEDDTGSDDEASADEEDDDSEDDNAEEED